VLAVLTSDVGDRARTAARAASRLALGGVFVGGGADAFRNPTPRAAKAEAAGLPYPVQATQANAATMVVAGTALGLGFFPRWAAGALLASLVPTTLAGHAWWREEDAQARRQQRTQFLKNLAIMGGLVAVVLSDD
jgi:putative oxidoreductase